MPPNSLLIGGRFSRKGLEDAVDAARSEGADKIFVRTSSHGAKRLAEELGAEPLGSGREELLETVRGILSNEGGAEPPGDLKEKLNDELAGPIDAVVVVGENRLVDSALWGTAYSEFFFVDELSDGSIREVFSEFDRRSRRFGR